MCQYMLTWHNPSVTCNKHAAARFNGQLQWAALMGSSNGQLQWAGAAAAAEAGLCLLFAFIPAIVTLVVTTSLTVQCCSGSFRLKH